MLSNEKLYTASKAAKKLQVHTSTVKRWHRDGKIRCVQVGGGWLRIPESEINRILGTVEE